MLLQSRDSSKPQERFVAFIHYNRENSLGGSAVNTWSARGVLHPKDGDPEHEQQMGAAVTASI